MKSKIPGPAISRLCMIHNLLDELAGQGHEKVSSSMLGSILGVGSHNVRKDINCLGSEVGDIGSGYDIMRLKSHIRRCLGLDRKRNACVVGLGRVGTAIIAYERFANSGFAIVAGFDTNLNKLETMRTSIDLFPAHDIVDVVRQKKIDLAVIAVPASAAQETADRLIEGGVRGIVNFSPALLACDSRLVHVTNMDIVREFTILSAHIALVS